MAVGLGLEGGNGLADDVEAFPRSLLDLASVFRGFVAMAVRGSVEENLATLADVEEMVSEVADVRFLDEVRREAIVDDDFQLAGCVLADRKTGERLDSVQSFVSVLGEGLIVHGFGLLPQCDTS